LSSFNRPLAVALLSGATLFPAVAEADEAAADPVIVVTGQNDGYRAIDANGTKTPTPLIDVPQSVTVLTREQLDDQGVHQLNDALRYIPGVVLGQGEGHRDQIVLRGQSSTADFFLDGLRDDAQYYRPLYNIERIEVLKGANALLFGRGGGGGAINRVSKTPQFDGTRITAEGSVDTWGAYSLSGDLNAALSPAIAVRLNGIYEEFDNHRDFYEGRFIGVNPTLAFDLGENDRLELSYSRDDDARTTDRGVPSLNGSPIRGYERTFFGSPTLNRSEVVADIAHARYDHNFTDTLSVNVIGQYSNVRKYYGNVYANSATASTVTLAGYNSTTDRESWIGQANLVWQGETGSVKHTLLAGVEAGDQDTDATRAEVVFAKAGGGTSTTTTVPLGRTITFPTASFTPISRSSLSHVRSLSAYVQDQVELIPELQLVAGIRYDDFRITSLNRINQFAGERSDGKWSPRFGVIAKPMPNISIYASYAKSFLPQSGDQFTVLDATTETLAPEEFRNIEAGVKWDLRPDLSLTAAVYQLDRSNSRSTDPVTGNAVLTGKTRTKGIEAQLAGRITPEWQLSLGYAYQDGKVRSATTAAPAGRRIDKLPEHQFSAWSRYDVTSRLGFGLGVTHQSSSFATISNAVRLPAYTRVDAAVFFDLTERVSLQVNVENLLDENYFPSAHTDNNIATGEPLNARLTVKVKL
jgi:catecholate siderophore receptor